MRRTTFAIMGFFVSTMAGAFEVRDAHLKVIVKDQSTMRAIRGAQVKLGGSAVTTYHRSLTFQTNELGEVSVDQFLADLESSTPGEQPRDGQHECEVTAAAVPG